MKNIDFTKTVLLVEDEAIISIITTKLIKKAGYDVVTANSGEKAVELVAAGKQIDLILMDIDLGTGIDGTETARRILSIINIPIVFHTSHSEREMVEKVQGITRYGYVIKSSGDFVLQSSIEMAFELFDAHKNLETTIKSLRQSDERYALINNSSLDFIYSYDINSRYTSANKKLCDVLNLKEDQIIGKNHSELGFPEALCIEWDSVHKELFKADTTIKTNTTIPWSEGKIYTYEVILNPLHNANGEIIGIGGTSRNITDKKKTEDELQLKNEELRKLNEELNATVEELEASNEEMAQINEEIIQANKMLEEKEEEYNILFESSSSGVFIIDNNRLKIMNSMVNKILGYSAEVLTNENFINFIHPDDRDLTMDYYKRKLNGEKFGTDHSFRVITADGETRWISNKSVLISINGKISTLNYASDITDSVTAENSRAESEQRYRALFDHSPQGLVHFDINGKIKKCNSAFVGIIGSSKEKLIGLNMLDLPDKKLTSAIQCALCGEISGYDDIYHSVTAEKSTPVKLTIAPIKNTENGILGGIIIAEDKSISYSGFN